MEQKKALDPKCELVHILAGWTWGVLLMKHTNVPVFVIDSNRFFCQRKGALKMELVLDACAEVDHQTMEPFGLELNDLELALVGGGIGDVVPA
jgi:hypothetical protein